MVVLKHVDFEVPDFGEMKLPTQAVPSYSQAIDALGPLAYWRMSDTVGSTLTDQTGNYPLTLTGNHTPGQPGALVTDDDLAIHMGNATALAASPVLPGATNDPFSIAFWIRIPPGPINSRPFMGQFVSQGFGRTRMLLEADGRLHFLTIGNPSLYTTELVTEDWRFAVLSRSASGLMSWYIDGQLDTQGTGHDREILATPFLLGAFSASYADFYIDELAIFDTALSLDQVRWLYGLAQGQLTLPPGL